MGRPKLDTKYARVMGQRIKRERKRKRLTQFELATRLGIDKSVVTRIERGSVSLSAQRVEQIATVLGVRVSRLYKAVAANG